MQWSATALHDRNARRDDRGFNRLFSFCLVWIFLGQMIAGESQAEKLTIHFRTQTKGKNAEGFSFWKTVETEKTIQTEERDRSHIDPHLPVQTNGYTCDSEPNFGNVERQHPAIRIDREKDVLSSDKQEIWNLFYQKKIENVLFAGFLTGENILNSPVGVKQMSAGGSTRWC